MTWFHVFHFLSSQQPGLDLLFLKRQLNRLVIVSTLMLSRCRARKTTTAPRITSQDNFNFPTCGGMFTLFIVMLYHNNIAVLLSTSALISLSPLKEGIHEKT
jgi:hypothetical protein